MNFSPCAAQLYTVRDFCGSPADLAATAGRLRSIGYGAVELFGGENAPDDEMGRIFAGEGLVICSAHFSAGDLFERPERCSERLRRFGCRQAAFPFPAGVDFRSETEALALIPRLAAAGARLRADGITLSYHNHAIEFVKFRGRPWLEILYAETDAGILAAELDTYWVHFGGGDVVEWCRRLRGRLPCLHLKDYGFTADNRPMLCELGAGTLPFARILPAAAGAGTQWLIVEQDTCPGDPFDSLRRSYDHLQRVLLAAEPARS